MDYQLLFAYIQKNFNGGYEGMQTSLKSVEFVGYDDETKLLCDGNNRPSSKTIARLETSQ
jgi:hypothetical protein